jgi:hypothetical protein
VLSLAKLDSREVEIRRVGLKIGEFRESDQYLSFPKITSIRIRAVQQNQRVIQRDARGPDSDWSRLSPTCSSRRTDLKSRTSSCDISSVSPCGVHNTVYIRVAG